MKSITGRFIAIIAMTAFLSAFTSKFGGEGFEIYLNGKMWVQQYGSEMKSYKTISLENTKADDELTIKYHHCGKTGLNRVVSIRDEQNNILKEFRFENSAQPLAAMTMKLGDISRANKKNGTLKLYYTSSELPKGRMLVSIKPASKDLTSR